MAALRRGLGKPPGTVANVHPYVLPWLKGVSDGWQENAFYIVASLFAIWHQGKQGPIADAPRNLGASLGRLKDDSESTEKRFVALLNSHSDDLHVRLRHAVSLLASKTPVVPVDWAQLLEDLRRWDSEYRTVQRNWARGFWKTDETANPEDDAETSEQPIE